ncbi:MAG: PQQ-binding-like beta-propeller repeat protein [Betaproteobacteria bacterium]|nr:PQQ-binding-like beta-propeller repeat protein [Betaproteobacteria bacterium]
MIRFPSSAYPSDILENSHVPSGVDAAWKYTFSMLLLAAAALTVSTAIAQTVEWTSFQYSQAETSSQSGCNFASAGTLAIGPVDQIAVTGSATYRYAELTGSVMNAQTGSTQWSRPFAGAKGGHSCGRATAFDGNGDVYVVGFLGALPYGFRDAVVLKADGGSGEVLWSRVIENGDSATDVKVDSSGHPIVTGIFGTMKLNGQTGASIWSASAATASGFQLVLDAGGNAYVRSGSRVTKLSASTGSQLWVVAAPPEHSYFGGIAIDEPSHLVWLRSPQNAPSPSTALKLSLSTGSTVWERDLGVVEYFGFPVVDANGNVFVTGTATSSGVKRIRTTRLASASGTVDWNVETGGGMDGSFRALSVALDASGNVFAVGNKLIPQMPPGLDKEVLHLSKHAGATGLVQWTQTSSVTPGESLWSVAPLVVNGSGDPIVATVFERTLSEYVFRVAKFDGQSGANGWIQPILPDLATSTLFDLTSDASGNVFTLGWVPALNGDRVRLEKRLSTGVESWTTHLSTPKFQGRFRVAMLSGGDPVIAFGPYAGGNQSVASFSTTNGTLKWSVNLTVSADEYIADLRTGPDGHVHVLTQNGTAYRVIQVNGANGQINWQRASAAAEFLATASLHVGASGAVIVASGERLPNMSQVVRVTRINPQTGTDVWSNTRPGIASNVTRAMAGASGDAYVLFFENETNLSNTFALAKLAAADGSDNWKVLAPYMDFSRLAVDPMDNVLLWGSTNGSLYQHLSKLSSTSGALMWSRPVTDSFGYIIGLPAVDSAGDVYLCTVGGSPLIYAPMSVRKIAGSDGRALWKHTGPTPDAESYPGGIALGNAGSVFLAANAMEAWRPVTGYVRKLEGGGNSGPAIETILAVQISGSAGGRVVSAPVGLNCPSYCVRTFSPGSMVTLTATATNNSTFLGWSGAGCSGTGNCVVSLDASSTVTASFAPRTYTLQVVKSGSGSGRVVSASAGIDCGSQCSVTVNATTEIHLSPTADAGSVFVSQSFGCAPLQGSSIAECLASGATTVTASVLFVSGERSVTIEPQAFDARRGRVVSEPSGIDCPSVCSYRFPASVTVVLRATPFDGRVFSSWTSVGGNPCVESSGTTCTLSGNSDASVFANFNYKPTIVTVVKTGQGSGRVATNDLGIDCGAVCTGPAPATASSAALIQATPDSGSVFIGFSGCVNAGNSPSDPQCTPRPFVESTIEARFEPLANAAPSAPLNVRAIAGDRKVTVLFDAPATMGLAPISGYQAHCQPGNFYVNAFATPFSISSLENGVNYTCSLYAKNHFGDGQVSMFAFTPTASAPFNLVTAFSRKSHMNQYGGLDSRDIVLDITKVVNGDVTVEPRTNGRGLLVVFLFSDAINASGVASVKDKDGLLIGVPSVSILENEVRVSISGVPDRNRIEVSLMGVNGAFDAKVALGLLIGDVDRNRVVDSADQAALRSRSGRFVDFGSAGYDINLSGKISAADLMASKRRNGASIR